MAFQFQILSRRTVLAAAFALLAPSMGALAATPAESFISDNIQKGLVILNDPQLSAVQRGQVSFSHFDGAASSLIDGLVSRRSVLRVSVNMAIFMTFSLVGALALRFCLGSDPTQAPVAERRSALPPEG